MLDRPGHYLLTAPRTELLDEHGEWLRNEARERGVTVRIEVVHAAQGRPDVPRRIADACQSLSQVSNGIGTGPRIGFQSGL